MFGGHEAFTLPAIGRASANWGSDGKSQIKRENSMRRERGKKKHRRELVAAALSAVALLAASPKQPQQPVGPAQAACSQDITLMKLVDRASPAIFAKAAAGENINKATFSMRKAGESPQDFLVITLSDVLITSVSQTGNSETPMESVSLGFSSAKISFKPDSDTGAPEDAIDATVPGSCR
jgi:type VI secretion system secreted protein Hcp